jgi:muramoyltetrapeptide carboxypeptidase LdcA involved in peptidoglycan recycling
MGANFSMNIKYLSQGDTIGFLSPSSSTNLDSLKYGIDYLNHKGFFTKEFLRP